MAGMRPFFLTGANAKIRINGMTLAYVTNLSYSVDIAHANPTTLGMYEPASIEPLSYLVTGSFSVVRYIADITDDTATKPNGTTDRGNGIGGWGPEGTLEKFKRGFDIKKGADGRAYENMNPSKLHKATGFDIEVYQKHPNGQRSVAKVRGARITKANFSIGNNTAGRQNFNFTALYLDEDSFLADMSGRGQNFA